MGHFLRWFGAALVCGCDPDVTVLPPDARDAAVRSVPSAVQLPALESSSEPIPAEVPRALRVLPALNPSDPYPQRWVVQGDTSAGDNQRSDHDCAALGPDWTYDLDLRAFGEPITVRLGLRAAFDGSLRLEQGPWEDPFLVACNEDHAPGAKEAFLGLQLAPARYRLVVDGEQPSDRGAFELVLELPAKDGRCALPPPNDRCAEAVSIDPRLPVQTFFGSTRCASDQVDVLWECGSLYQRGGDVFYSLDVSEFAAPVMLHASTDLPPTNAPPILFIARDAGGTCGPATACARGGDGVTNLWAKLDPGRYFLGVESAAGDTGEFGLKVELDGEPCIVTNDTCQTAQVIEPRWGTQTLTAWPMCGDDSISSDCGGVAPNPDIFYRLDLSAFQQAVHVRANAERMGERYDSLVLLGDGGGTCGSELWCGDFDLWLQPKSYYLALDGFRDQQGPVLLRLWLDVEAPPVPAECIDAQIATCAHGVDCCAGDGPECWLALMSCGLRPEVLDCLCAAEPLCCGAPGNDVDAACGDWLEQCDTFCADFDRVLACPA